MSCPGRLQVQVNPGRIVVTAVAAVFGPAVDGRIGESSRQGGAQPDLVKEPVLGQWGTRRVKSVGPGRGLGAGSLTG